MRRLSDDLNCVRTNAATNEDYHTATLILGTATNVLYMVCASGDEDRHASKPVNNFRDVG